MRQMQVKFLRSIGRSIADSLKLEQSKCTEGSCLSIDDAAARTLLHSGLVVIVDEPEPVFTEITAPAPKAVTAPAQEPAIKAVTDTAEASPKKGGSK